MVEHAVKDHPDSSLVGLADQLGKQLVAGLQVGGIGHALQIAFRPGVGKTGPESCNPVLTPGFRAPVFYVLHDLPEMGINVFVVLRVVFVAGRGQKNRVQVDCLNPQVLQIIQLFHDPLEVSAVELAVADGGGRLIPVVHFYNRTPHIIIFPVNYIVGFVSIEKAVHKNLVHDSPDRPFGRMESRHHVPPVSRADGIADPTAGVAIFFSSRDEHKIISERTFRHFKCDTVVIKKLIRFRKMHPQMGTVHDEKADLHFVFSRAQADRHLIMKIRLGGNEIFLCRITEKGS